MTRESPRMDVQNNCLLRFRVCKTIFEDEDIFAVSYGIKAVDEQGNLRVHIREVSSDYIMVRELVDKLNQRVVSQVHLMDKLYKFTQNH